VTPFVKAALGALAGWAVFYALAVLAPDMDFPAGPGSGDGSLFLPFLRGASVLNALLVFCAFAALALRSNRIPAYQKLGWVFGMMFFYPFVLPAFWYLHIWRAPQAVKNSRATPPPD
jgi:hypothetical protein